MTKEEIKEYNRKYWQKYGPTNREKVRKRSALWRNNNPDYFKNWRRDNLDYLKDYRNENRPRFRAYHRNYKNTRRRNDPLFQLTEDIRRRFRVALRRGCKNGSAVKDLGCSIEEFKNHIEARFLPGMTWTNRSEWHLDHIIPLSLFDLQDRNQLVVALNYRNYQPLWAKDNMRKNATLDPSHEPLLYEIIDAVHQVN